MLRAFPARRLSCVAWPGRMLIGQTLGPLALLLILVLLFAIQGTLSAFSLAHTEGLLAVSILFPRSRVYTRLLHKLTEKPALS
jgi:hypothetical protein